MPRRAAVAIPFAALAALSACTQVDDDSSSASMVTSAEYAPYPTSVRSGMVRLDRLDMFDVSVGDFGTDVRDQGAIGSCASFGFIGLLENQMFNKRGISPDLSERFMIFSNFFQTGSLGDQPAIIKQFPSLVKNLGVVNEPEYPYSFIAANAHRFSADAAQGLSTSEGLPTLDEVIEGTADFSEERSRILQRDEFIGKLPGGPTPITLPAKARLHPNAKVPEIEYEGKIYQCFSAAGPEGAPAEKQLKVTPREFLEMCFDLDPSAYFSCSFDPAAAEASVKLTATDECGARRELVEKMAPLWLDASKKSLELTLSLLDAGEASFVAVMSPDAGPQRAVWATKNATHTAGHAVLAIGYLTYGDLASGVEKPRGLLMNGTFDKLAGLVEPDYAAKIADGLPADATARRDLRLSSKLGQVMKTEGGILFFRNSWSKEIPGLRIGLDGHQAMTFDYFLKGPLLVTMGRSQPTIPGIAWQRGAGPDYCPATVEVPQGGSWLKSSDRLQAFEEVLAKQLITEKCAR